MVRLAREVPLNPNLVLYHTEITLTRAWIEVDAGSSVAAPAPASLLIERGAIHVELRRYRLRVRKSPGEEMVGFLRTIEPALCDWAELDAILPAPEHDPRWQRFPVPFDPTAEGPRRYYPSPEEAQAHPIAASLFEIDGVAEVLLTPETIAVAKGALFPWNPIASRVGDVLEDVTATYASRGGEAPGETNA